MGIDLGTTNSEVAFATGGQPRVLTEDDDGILPSVVGLGDDGKVIVGRAARNQYPVYPERTVISIKRKMGSDERVAMGSQTYSPQEISALILKRLKDRASATLRKTVERVVVTVPAYFTDAQRQATREAASIAGLQAVRIINEPTAAALAYEAKTAGRQKILVYDLGGGTFDVSVVVVEDGVVEVLSSTGDNHLGGDDFDALIVERLIAQLQKEHGIDVIPPVTRARLKQAAEAAKIQLSTAPVALIQEDYILEKAGRPCHLVSELKRYELEDMIEGHLSATMRSVTRALEDARVTPSEIDKILLVGGSTRIPRISELLREKLRKEPHGEVDPDLCVALGAAVQAGMEMGIDVGAVLVDITPYTFGTRVVDHLTGDFDQFHPIIRRNTKLPASRTDLFSTIYEDQERVQITVFQGEQPRASDNVLIGEFELAGLNETSEAYEGGILFTYALNLDGILEIKAVERATGREITGRIENAMARPDEEQLEASRRKVAELWREDAAAPGIAAQEDAQPAAAPADFQIERTVSRARKLMKQNESDRAEIERLTNEIEAAQAAGDKDRAHELCDALDDVLFYLE